MPFRSESIDEKCIDKVIEFTMNLSISTEVGSQFQSIYRSKIEEIDMLCHQGFINKYSMSFTYSKNILPHLNLNLQYSLKIPTYCEEKE